MLQLPQNDFRRSLQAGDTVFWNDPDDGACSRYLEIHKIVYLTEEDVRITESGGSVVECCISELS